MNCGFLQCSPEAPRKWDTSSETSAGRHHSWRTTQNSGCDPRRWNSFLFMSTSSVDHPLLLVRILGILIISLNPAFVTTGRGKDGRVFFLNIKTQLHTVGRRRQYRFHFTQSAFHWWSSRKGEQSKGGDFRILACGPSSGNAIGKGLPCPSPILRVRSRFPPLSPLVSCPQERCVLAGHHSPTPSSSGGQGSITPQQVISGPHRTGDSWWLPHQLLFVFHSSRWTGVVWLSVVLRCNYLEMWDEASMNLVEFGRVHIIIQATKSEVCSQL